MPFATQFTLSDWRTVLDLILVATILYNVYLLVRETRALRILLGILLVAFLYLLSEILALPALNFVLRSAFTVALVAIPVVFQPELRVALERLGRGELLPAWGQQRKTVYPTHVIQMQQALIRLADERIGALIVIEQETGLKDLADSGIQLRAQLTPELLETIFTPRSPLHDGAAILKGQTIIAANVFLPLSDESPDRSHGTRHRAAIGVTKETDAIAIAVSEQTGRISVAYRGHLHVVSREHVAKRLRQLIRT